MGGGWLTYSPMSVCSNVGVFPGGQEGGLPMLPVRERALTVICFHAPNDRSDYPAFLKYLG